MVANGASRKILLFSAYMIFAGGTAFACGSGTCPCETLAQTIDALTAADAQANEAAWAQYTNLQKYGDQDFLEQAMETSAAKVMLAELALKRSQRADVKQFAQKVIQDQIELSQKVLERVGKPLGVEEEKDLSKKDKQLVARLTALSGAQFDEEYVRALLKEQKLEMKKFSDETQLAADPRVSLAAAYDSNLTSQHLGSLQKIAEGHALLAENQQAPIATK